MDWMDAWAKKLGSRRSGRLQGAASTCLAQLGQRVTTGNQARGSRSDLGRFRLGQKSLVLTARHASSFLTWGELDLSS